MTAKAKKQLEELKGDQKVALDRLLDLRTQIMDQVRDISASNLSSNKQAGEELADIGSDNFYREIGLSMLSEDGKRLMQIQDAIERLQNGEYGICEDCECQIPGGRLKALPYAKLCVDCQAEVERKIEEFGEDYEEEEEEVGSFGGDDDDGDVEAEPEVEEEVDDNGDEE